MIRLASAAAAALLTIPAGSLRAGEDSPLRAGRGFIETSVHAAEDDNEPLELFAGLRVADVTDGMDPAIHPLWKDPKEFTHRFIGIAVTARYVPTQRAQAGRLPAEEYDAWAGTPVILTMGT